MELVADIHVNGRIIGRVACRRISGGIGKYNRYAIQAVAAPHPTTGLTLSVTEDDGFIVDHHYDDSALLLIGAAIEALEDVLATD